MKKTALFSIFALGLAMVSCEDFDYPNPPAQSNEQLPVLDASGVAVSPVIAGQTIDLKTLSEAGQTVTLGKLDATGEFDAALYDFSFAAEMAGDESFNGAVAIATRTVSNEAKVSPDDIDAAFKTVFQTIDPAARTAWFRLKAYAQNKETGTKYRINGEKVFYAAQNIEVVPFAPDFTVEEKYYIIGTSTDDQIKSEGAILMSNGGGSPYDKHSFTAFVEVTAAQAQAGYNWAVVPESTMAAGSGVVMAPTFEYVGESKKGYLSDQTSLGNWNTIYAEGKYLVTVDVKANAGGYYDFSYFETFDFLYTPGGSNNWTPAASQPLFTSNYTNFTGYAYLNGEFKLSKAPDWNHGDFGGDADGNLTVGGGNLPGPDPAGLYWIEADIIEMSYKLTHISTYGIIGNATTGGWDASVAMTPSEDFLKWTLSTELKAGEMKFRANDAWDIDLGGLGENNTPQEPVLELKHKGSNIVINDAGNYDIVLDFSKYPYTCTLTKK